MLDCMSPPGSLGVRREGPFTRVLAGVIQSIVANQVISLPVSTTSYFRHVVSTVQTQSAMPTMERSSIDTGGDFFSSILYH